MNNELLDKIIAEAPEDVRIRLGELGPAILAAAAAALTETQEDEKAKAVVNVSFALKINLTASPIRWSVKAAVATKTTSEGEEHQADLTPELPGMEVQS